MGQLDDPAGQGIDVVRPIRDEIRRRVESLITELPINLLTDLPDALPAPGPAQPMSSPLVPRWWQREGRFDDQRTRWRCIVL
jgi:hypothetical protein